MTCPRCRRVHDGVTLTPGSLSTVCESCRQINSTPLTPMPSHPNLVNGPTPKKIRKSRPKES